MALPAMLSAVRELLLDRDELPSTESERLDCYSKWFPKLSAEEQEDLSKIPPERLRVYTATIFTGEASVILNHFPVTCAILAKHWKTITGQQFSGYRFLRRMHKSRPWKSKETWDLAENFLTHLREDITELATLAPEIYSTDKLEFSTLVIKRHTDKQYPPDTWMSQDELTGATVEQLLEFPFVIPASTAFELFEYDVVSLFRDFHTGGRTLPDEVQRIPTHAAGGRNADLFARWLTLPKELFEWFNSLERSTEYPLGLFAEAMLAQADANLPEEQLFAEWLGLLGNLREAGILVLPRSPLGG